MRPRLKQAIEPLAEEILHRVRYNRSALGLWLYRRQQRRAVRDWERRGRPSPPPDAIKQAIIRRYARRFGTQTLVETGTFVGDTTYALRNDFVRIVTIELDRRLAREAAQRLRKYPQIAVIQGNSVDVLSRLAREPEGPAVFWIDAHFSAGVTAMGDEVSPALRELELVLARSVAVDVVLIDDARLFGTPGYPNLEDTIAYIRSRRPGWEVSVEDDMIRAHPAAESTG